MESVPAKKADKNKNNNYKLSKSFKVPDMNSFLDTKIVYPTKEVKETKFNNLISRNPADLQSEMVESYEAKENIEMQWIYKNLYESDKEFA